MSNPFSLQGKRILITGASSGIGRQTAIAAADLGALLVLTGRNEERLNETLSKLSNPENHVSIAADLSEDTGILALTAEMPLLDGIVMAAGRMELCPVKFLKPEFLNDILTVNFLKPAELLVLLLKKKRILSNSSIVFITSINGSVIGSLANSAYGASKGAIDSFSKGIALDLAKQQIRVNCIAPGMIETEGTTQIEMQVSADSIVMDKEKYPLGRYGTPVDVANGCIYLLSNASSWITGITLIIDGGFTAK
jgi:NAD(P)-dependent dehydrogenase (short-subunit alcohol dehydrogenase family)